MNVYLYDVKSISKLLLIVFISFLSIPTLVTLIEKNKDISIFYSFAEEEINKQIKGVKAEVKHHFDYIFLDLQIENNIVIISENLSRYDNVASEIFSPPPDFS